MSQDDVGRMFVPGPRKSAQRSNSSTSLNSTASSTVSTSSVQTNGTATGDGWATRKKTNRSLWPQGKSEPTASLTTPKTQPVSSGSQSSAASAISALHTPSIPSQQQLANGQAQQNGALRNGNQQEVPALLYLLPMNGTFERKTISVPYYPDILRIGRQTNAKTAPTPANGFFDSKVLSRQHAEVYAERNGRIFIRDVKSSNGTFVNGKRLSPENKESEPHELREQDVLELGIDIVSEDQKTVVHHKVAARVEHAGIYTQNGDIAFGDLDPSGQFQQMKRAGAQGSLQGAKGNSLAAAGMSVRDGNNMQQQSWGRWTSSTTTEQIVKRLNRELTLARQQSSDIARAKQALAGVLEIDLADVVNDEKKIPHQVIKPSPVKSKHDNKHFSEPPAPPPQQPLPAKPDVAKALADPVIQPLLQRSHTARPSVFTNSSPNSADQSQALLVLTSELKLAKEQIPRLEDRVKNLEQALQAEKTLRETAEERADVLEKLSRKDSGLLSNGEIHETADTTTTGANSTTTDEELHNQLERLRATVDEMKQHMESYRRRAETAEAERDESRKTLAEMIEEKRNANIEAERVAAAQHATITANHHALGTKDLNGHLSPPETNGVVLTTLLEKAGITVNQPMSKEQAANLQKLLNVEAPDSKDWSSQLSYHGIPHACALSTIVVGLALMHYLNGWEKIQR
ncbi:hypothetical protein MBLNU457_4768t2 [Dothideomycetes sp. NU457]